jgi:hypothetical protein
MSDIHTGYAAEAYHVAERYETGELCRFCSRDCSILLLHITHHIV